MMLAAFVILVCGLAAVLYFVSVRRGLPPERPEQEREKVPRPARRHPPAVLTETLP